MTTDRHTEYHKGSINLKQGPIYGHISLIFIHVQYVFNLQTTNCDDAMLSLSLGPHVIHDV